MNGGSHDPIQYMGVLRCEYLVLYRITVEIDFVLLLSLTVMIRLSRSLRVSATQDTDKPEVQPVSVPESLHSCVLTCVRVGQA